MYDMIIIITFCNCSLSQIREQEERLKIVENFAKETSKKYKELLESHNIKRTKISDTNLNEINSQLKKVKG